MLLHPRAYKLSANLADRRGREDQVKSDWPLWEDFRREHACRSAERKALKMLLLHQSGSVKVGEVVRYTLTYTPSNDRILPTPSHLHVKIKNTSAIPLRAAYLHGPYTLHVAAYPASFNPHHKVENPQHDGTPEFEPMLKAGGSWTSKLTVPSEIRETGADLGKRRQSQNDEERGSATWIIEVTSQILFSNSASVGFEVLVGRDERSLDLGFAAVAGRGHGVPGQVEDSYEHSPGRGRVDRDRRKSHQSAGVYSKAVKLQVEDTEALWDKPAMPTWEVKDSDGNTKKRKRRKKVHLVVVTHGLHSNLGADMLFMKESIDATVKQARMEKTKRKRSSAAGSKDSNTGKDNLTGGDQHGALPSETEDASTAPLTGGQEDIDSDDEEETVVRGFTGNAVRTENGIQYLGKRLAKYILKFTYPDQPFLPIKKTLTKQLTDTFKSSDSKAKDDQAKGVPIHEHSSVHHENSLDPEKLPYRFTSISFIGHSLGGLVQTYAVAYIHKHSPGFFKQIEPVNFICLASPLLGLSNENPMYVRFALDFGLVGRTGQDLGLTWRPPTMVRGGWNAVIAGLGAQKEDQKNDPNNDPGAKPLLRILPTGPAHQVLRKFRNRTVYSNVVNDGIVPLRTSCLLFLDWRGLDKVEKARRENGLIGTMAEWGWAEFTGANESERSQIKNSILARTDRGENTQQLDSDDEHVRRGEGDTVPQPDDDEITRENTAELQRLNSAEARNRNASVQSVQSVSEAGSQQESGVWHSLMSFFRPATPERNKSPANRSKKTTKALKRGQTLRPGEDEPSEDVARGRSGTTTNPTMRPHLPHLPTGHSQHKRPKATRGDSLVEDEDGLQAPPKTSIFESATDILHPPIPSKDWIIDPTTRARTIFHDRIYHPDDIPPPPVKRPGSRLIRTFSSESSSRLSQSSQGTPGSGGTQTTIDTSGMKVEEKIARAYHKDLSWRKVLVRLEPDAHNNMIVRRMFANAYGWPVVKHLCDTHFGDTYSANTRDEDEPARERAKPMSKPIGKDGEHVEDQTSKAPPKNTSESELREARDEVATLQVTQEGVGSISSAKRLSVSRDSSSTWDDSFFDSNADDSDIDERGFLQRMMAPLPKDPESPPELRVPELAYHRPSSSRSNDKASSPATSFEYHRGLGPRSPTSPKTPQGVKTTHDASQTSPIVANKLVEEPEALHGTSSAASVGLRKTVEEQVSPTKRKLSGGSSDGGVTEVVARLSTGQD